MKKNTMNNKVKILNKNKKYESFNSNNLIESILKANRNAGFELSLDEIIVLVSCVYSKLKTINHIVSTETIKNIVIEELLNKCYFITAKKYIKNHIE